MNRSQIEAKERGLTALARKVYDATPISTPWELNRIIAELHRTGCTAEYRAIQGCLSSLQSDRLVREVGKNVFQRVEKREKPEKQPEQEPEEMPVKSVEQVKLTQQDDDPIKKIGDLAAAVRAQSVALAKIATEIEDVALEIQTTFEKSAEATNRLRTLQSLLKEL